MMSRFGIPAFGLRLFLFLALLAMGGCGERDPVPPESGSDETGVGVMEAVHLVEREGIVYDTDGLDRPFSGRAVSRYQGEGKSGRGSTAKAEDTAAGPSGTLAGRRGAR